MRRILAVAVVLMLPAVAGAQTKQAERTLPIRAAAVKKVRVLPPLHLPNIKVEVRRLEKADRRTVQRQLVASESVVRFWEGEHAWVLAPRHQKCSEVAWQRSCTVARASYRLHYALAEKARESLDATDPIVQRLNAGLRGTPMSGLGRTLRDIGRRYNVSPFFMAAAAGTESSFGAAGCGNNPKNVWGLAACDGRWHVPYFNTWEEAIGFYAQFIRSHWPNATSPYHLYGYAACDACWGRKTSMWMTSRFGVAAYTKYPE